MIRTVVAGLGYFSQFHIDAWQTHPGATIVGVIDRDAERAKTVGTALDTLFSTDLPDLVVRTRTDVLDIVAPPTAHVNLIRAVLGKVPIVICQKPFCTSVEEADAIIQEAAGTGTQIVIHENFRFQPWYRDLKDHLDRGDFGQIYGARFALRPGDGRGPDAYLDRQPTFQTMPRLLVHETAVHFIDLFGWLLGDIQSVYADLRRLNPAIAGEDAGTLLMQHASGAQSVFDGNRLTDHVADNPRLTMGEFELTCEAGTIMIDGAGVLRFRGFGSATWTALPATHPVDDASFGGGCVFALIGHVIDHFQTGRALENEAADYLPVMRVSDAAYLSASEGRKILL